MNLNQVTVASTDVARGIEFYSKLGLKLIVKSPPKYARFECPEGQSTFSLHNVEEFVPSETVVYFECARLDETVGKLQQLGISFTSLPRDQSWLWREARLLDPDGNEICLFYAGPNRLNPPWRVA
jgi:catechol 2,3-dioxygenase-like lactoylglutathione lyase family enzyme